MSRAVARLCCVGIGLLLAVEARADLFTVRDSRNESHTLEAELIASEQGIHVLGLNDGQYVLIPQEAILKREPKDPPAPLTPKEMVDELTEKYGADNIRTSINGQYVIALILETPLPKTSEGRVKSVLGKGTKFLKQVETAFGQFVKEAKLKATPPRFPLVCLVFETDQQFDQYAGEITGNRGLQAGSLSGFYSKLSNLLAIRLTECMNFEVPFHEAIHQQVYNRGLLQRMAPIPAWFDEGIATGFEASNNKNKAVSNPIKISPRYAAQALFIDSFDWDEMLGQDRVFRGDVLAAEAYGQAWGLHWLLINKYKTEYNKYLQILAAKTPLQPITPAERRADFAAAFSKSIHEFEREFPDVLRSEMVKGKMPLERPKPPGWSITESGLGKVEMTAVEAQGVLRVEGKLLNLSPLRPMAFHIAVTTDGGHYADWYIDKLDSTKMVPLKIQAVTKRIPNARSRGDDSRFRVLIRSTSVDSTDASRWRSGALPVPPDVFGGE